MMSDFQQPSDFLAECRALDSVIADLDAQGLKRITRFKEWTIEDVLQHLHIWNWAVDEALMGTQEFKDFIAEVMAEIAKTGLRPLERRRLKGLEGAALVDAWRDQYQKTATAFQGADPKARIPWAGPDMSVRSAITARLMETWSHGQAIYDLLGYVRVDGDRIKNIAVLGLNTFAWSFENRRLPVPDNVPYLQLTAPSGEIWEWNAENADDRIEGSATEFCQVVAQTRNIADTKLQVTGETAKAWMAIAQCFAGPPMDPPPAGTRGLDGSY